jgi:hypothetical protein
VIINTIFQDKEDSLYTERLVYNIVVIIILFMANISFYLFK